MNCCSGGHGRTVNFEQFLHYRIMIEAGSFDPEAVMKFAVERVQLVVYAWFAGIGSYAFS